MGCLAVRRVTETLKDRYGRILALCNPDETWSPRRAGDALRDIRFGLHHYVAVGDGREADVRAIGGQSGGYLRSDWDDTTANNLDELPAPTVGNPLTGTSDVAVQVTEETVERLARAMYRVGATEHQGFLVEGDRYVELTLGAPSGISLLPTEPGETEARARLEVPVLYRARPIITADDIGETANALLHVRARVASAASPEGVQLLVDWSETTDDDVDMPGRDDPQIVADIARFARSQGAQGQDVRLPGLSDRAPLTELTTTFRRSAGKDVVGVTLSFGGAEPDPDSRLQGEIFLRREWALALSESIVLERVRDGLRQDIGALPPPFGPDPVILPGTTDVYLDSFDVTMSDGSIVFEGQLRRSSTPVVTATYHAEVGLKLVAGRVQAKVGKIKVQTREWYASLADFVSGGAVSGAVERGLRQSLGANVTGRMTTYFSGDLLREIASVNTSRAIDVEPVLEEIEVRAAGIVAQGRLEIAEHPAPPVASFAVLPSLKGPQWRLLHAGASWAPSGSVESFAWSFGDGSDEELTGARTHFATEHEFAPGTFVTRLTVKDDHGATTTTAQSLEVT